MANGHANLEELVELTTSRAECQKLINTWWNYAQQVRTLAESYGLDRGGTFLQVRDRIVVYRHPVQCRECPQEVWPPNTVFCSRLCSVIERHKRAVAAARTRARWAAIETAIRQQETHQ